MKKISIAGLLLPVSHYCLGTMYFGTKVDQATSLRLMDLYADWGGNFFDSANKYASWVPGFEGGESERLIGKWLKGKVRDQYIITSKLGFSYGDVPRGLRPTDIIAECEKSLRRLGVDCIDIYFAHTQDEHTPAEESLRAFEKLKQSGKIRAFGASNFDAWRLAEANGVAQSHHLTPYVVLQQRYTLMQPYLGADLGTQLLLTPEHIDYCRQQQMVVMAYSPLLGGLYEQVEPAIPIQYDALHNRKLLDLLHTTAQKYHTTSTQLVLSWMAGQSILPIVTASHPEHLIQNLQPSGGEALEEFTQLAQQLDQFTIKYS